MRFRPDGPDIPDELVALQEKGDTIFICGAGVSRMVGLPSFRELLESVYEYLGEDWRQYPAEREVMEVGGRLANQYDRLLRILERRLAASDLPQQHRMREHIRTAVRCALIPPDEADLSGHLALLKLSRDQEGQSRIVTTNFDTLFERSSLEKHAWVIASHANSAMPQPKASGFRGVLHLHGRLADNKPELNLPDTDLVLTSAEFGDAYLRSGWASRYVYDLVRAHTVVLVGYEADDPPMRYLLEVLESDRGRFTDLHKVFAFAPSEPDDENLTAELWKAKGVEPILYRPCGPDHSALYDSLREWRQYDVDPTVWRREQLRPIMVTTPNSCAKEDLQRCASLLGHGDASRLLRELSPTPAWVAPLSERGVFGTDKVRPGEWIAGRLNDAEMIRAIVELSTLDDQSIWYIERAIEQNRGNLSPVRLTAWQLILRGKRRTWSPDLGYDWFQISRYIRQGDAGHNSRQLVRRILQPRLQIAKPFHMYQSEGRADEFMSDLLRIDFESDGHPTPREILQEWPALLDQEMALFRVLERGLVEALEEASDVGYIDNWDRASWDVPSIADHPQNAHHTGFFPIVRMIADLWSCIALKDPNKARALVVGWKSSPYLILRRLFLFAVAMEIVFPPDDAWSALAALENKIFWGGAQVEIMRLATKRWADFSAADREKFEARIRAGLPRELYPPDAFANEDDWLVVKDSAADKRLARLKSAGWPLSASSQAALDEIASRRPEWAHALGDRDDFAVWHESRSGPSGQTELLAGVKDDALVSEAMRLQRDRAYDQRDIWRLLTEADPERAFRGLKSDADIGRFEPIAWRDLLWAMCDKGDAATQFEVAAALLSMPAATLEELLAPATSWLQRRREFRKATRPKRCPFCAFGIDSGQACLPARRRSNRRSRKGPDIKRAK